jgi:hypothetical protein
MGFDLDEIWHIGLVLIVLWWRIDWSGWVSRHWHMRILGRVIIIGFAAVVPVCENVEIQFDLHFFYDFFLTSMIVVGLNLGIGSCVFTSSGLDLLQPLLLSW